MKIQSLKIENPPLKNGWRGSLNGVVNDTDTQITVSQIDLGIDSKTAWALCNILTDSALEMTSIVTDANQRKSLSNLGAAIGRLIDHHAANNGGRNLIKP